MNKTTCSTPGERTNSLQVHTHMSVTRAYLWNTDLQCLCKALAVLLLPFLLFCWLCEPAAVWPGCNFVVCALGTKYWSQDYSLALRVPSRCSQHHKYNTRVLWPFKAYIIVHPAKFWNFMIILVTSMAFFPFSTLLLMASVLYKAFSTSFAAVWEMTEVHKPLLREWA